MVRTKSLYKIVEISQILMGKYGADFISEVNISGTFELNLELFPKIVKIESTTCPSIIYHDWTKLL